MTRNSSELERLKHLRESQLADRDPTARKQQFHRQSVERERRAYQRLTLKDAWAEIPHIWKGLFYSLVLSLIGALVITSFWDSAWAWVISIILGLFFIIIGLSIGRAVDSRDEIRTHLR